MDSDSKKDGVAPSRRRFVSSVATGIAASAAAVPALAQQAEGNQPPPGRAREAAARYPAPPFPNQQQPWPGLASKMTPRPDHGETTYRGSGRLAGRKALVTGGDSGIGRAAVIAFAREGADVAINYLPAEEQDAQEVVQLIRQAGCKAVAIPGDIRDEAFCRKLVEEAVRQLGGLDILVNNASRQKSANSILDISTADFDWTIKTNVYAMFWITKAALPHLKAGSCIINTASQQAYDPSENLLDYSMSKAAEVAMTKSLAKQLASKGIRVNAVAPGPVWTPLQVSGGQTQENLKKFGSDTPMKRPGQPAELAATYVTLASDESSYTTGHVYGVSGGGGQP
ncbi:SDR family oxidoreductase [Massilia sp. 9I]|uniref:SDR family oxidoreductase n=1 Tax=Massilia sp. 9I TaxID=2653152 RepID=UPI0012F2F30A|nr:SDR family oxidoreductase [Massilia sp. 9I]VXC68493.1 putative glutathionylspermidine synthase, with NAD(P)-binding Rossmann-fold domain [Massilia sp. 9I]